MKYSEKDFFGGAITCDVPANWNNLSDIRPIPDNQECFQDSFVSGSPTILIVEILERQEHVNDDDAASFFFNDLAERNDAFQTQNDIRFHTLEMHDSSPALLRDDSIVVGKNTIHVCAGSGYQNVALGRDFDSEGNSRRARQEIKCIRVDLYVFRLPVQETDLLITISSPVDATAIDERCLEGPSAASAILSRVVSSFQINNWDLFG